MTIFIPQADSTEFLRALAEVNHFGTTDMGLPGQGPWVYRILEEQELSSVLASKANARSYDSVDIVTLQPCPDYIFQSQDRFIIEKWDLPRGVWMFNGVFDGHVNHSTVDYAIHYLPSLVKNRLQHLLCTARSWSALPGAITTILREAVIELDESLISGFLSIFPRSLDEMSDSEIQSVFENETDGMSNSEMFSRCIGGSTLIISLTDPTNHNLWIASLGDCRAVLFEKNGNKPWNGEQLNVLHNAENPMEAQLIRRAHPLEENVLVNNRLLGFLEPTRAIGNIWLKLPSVFLDRVFSRMGQPWLPAEKLRQYARHIRTPPYACNIPYVFHRVLPQRPWLLLLCTDGFPNSDSYTDMNDAQAISHWSQVVDRIATAESSDSNFALSLLKDALGGDNMLQVSRNLTVEMEDSWMDDITILIQHKLQ